MNSPRTLDPAKLYNSIKAEAGEETARKFMKYHMANKQVWKMLESCVLSEINRGVYKTWGMKAAAERVRYAMSKMTGKDFVISNSFISYYARAFVMKWPEHRKFLRLKRVKGIGKKQIELTERERVGI